MDSTLLSIIKVINKKIIGMISINLWLSKKWKIKVNQIIILIQIKAEETIKAIVLMKISLTMMNFLFKKLQTNLMILWCDFFIIKIILNLSSAIIIQYKHNYQLSISFPYWIFLACMHTWENKFVDILIWMN